VKEKILSEEIAKYDVERGAEEWLVVFGWNLCDCLLFYVPLKNRSLSREESLSIWHARGCGGSILTRILTGISVFVFILHNLSVADSAGGKGARADDLFQLRSSRIAERRKSVSSEGPIHLIAKNWQEGIFIVPHLLWHRTTVFPVSTEDQPIHPSLTTRKEMLDVEDLF
jgi:hypothetical protein